MDETDDTKEVAPPPSGTGTGTEMVTPPFGTGTGLVVFERQTLVQPNIPAFLVGLATGLGTVVLL